jgi:membrane-associated phospholipid phosphatase
MLLYYIVMNFGKIDEALLSKIIDFLYSLGFFGELILVFLVSANIYGSYSDLLIFYIGLMLNSLLNQTLKPWIKSPRPSGPIKFLAHEKIMKDSNQYGLPSGHSQNVFYALTYFYLTIYKFYPWTLVGCIIGLATIYERWAFRNHTAVQLLAGAALGSAFAYSVVMIREEIEKHVQKF